MSRPARLAAALLADFLNHTVTRLKVGRLESLTTP